MVRRVLTAACVSLLIVVSIVLARPAAAQAGASPGDIVITEVMQDPAAVGDSEGEYFEVFNATGADIDLNGWTISDNDADSHVIGASTVVPAGGYAVLGRNDDPTTNGGLAVAYEFSGVALANSADELVLTTPDSTEIDRIEWDGGPVWPDPTGASMQLCDVASDNNVGANWNTGTATYGAGDIGTPGAANDSTCDGGGGPGGDPANPGDIVISEVMQNPAAVNDNDGEYFEVFNATGADIDLNGWTISDNGSDSQTIAGSVVVPAGGYAVLGNNADSGTNGGLTLDYEYGTFFLGNSDDELVLIDPLATEIDRIEWDGGPNWPDPTGASMQLCDVASDNNVGANWNTGTATYGAGDVGTPGAANDSVCDAGPGPAAPGDIVITEVMQNPAAVNDNDGEYVEVYNSTGSDIDLDGWTISDLGTESHLIAGSVVVPAGGYAVLGINADSATNGGVGVAYQYADLFLGNSGDELVLTSPEAVEIDSIAWDGGPVWPDPTGASMQLCDLASDNNDGAGWAPGTATIPSGDVGTPGAANDSTCDGGGGPGGGTVTIMEIQGSGAASPLDGQAVETSGVVTGIVDNGFYLQDPVGDADPATSDGIFVFSSAVVAVGDAVTVAGTAAEFFDATQVAATTVTVTGLGTVPAPTPIDLEALGGALEPFEGMLVTPGTLFAGDVFDYLRFGEIVAYPFEPLQPTEVVDPGPAAAQLAADTAAAALRVDDGRGVEDDPLFPFLVSDGGVDRLVKWGDTLPDATGVLAFSFGNYKLVPTTGDPLVPGQTWQPTNPRPSGAPDPGGSITAASFNTLNFWTNDGGQERGARTQAQYDIQLAKLIDALLALDADVVALQELQNDPAGDAATSTDFDIGKESAEALADALNAALGETRYGWIDTGVIGTDAIKVGFIYDLTAVTPVGAPIIVGVGDPAYQPDRNRPSVIQGFEENATGAQFTAVSVHFKSKSGSELDDPGAVCVDGDPANDVPDCDQGDGAGFFNPARTAAAEVLAAFLADPANLPDPDVLVLGDFNAYTREDPVDVFVEDNGYANLGELSSDPISYTFFGLGGNLDHAVANGSLVGQVVDAEVFDINGTESNNQVYFESGFPGQLPQLDRFRSSDHSPIIVGLDLDAPDPVVTYDCGSVVFTEDELIADGYNLIIGDDGRDFIWGTNGNDFIFTAGGRDIVNAGGGDDIVCSGGGRDVVRGGSGNDELYLGGGRDFAFASDGDDLVDGGSGRDFADGGRGFDTAIDVERRFRFEA
ncbi:MAG: ExeM/NucH family extracellular endonuclease [Actinomycetota bacterium]